MAMDSFMDEDTALKTVKTTIGKVYRLERINEMSADTKSNL